MPRDDWVAGLVALFLGLVGLAILSEIFKPRCPRCNQPVDRGVRRCPHCGVVLEWH